MEAPEKSKISSILREEEDLDSEEFTRASITDVLIPFPASGMGLPSSVRKDTGTKLKRFNEAQSRFVKSDVTYLYEALGMHDGFKQQFHLSSGVIHHEDANKLGQGGGYSMVYKLEARAKHINQQMNGSSRGLVAMKRILRPTHQDKSADHYWSWLPDIGAPDKDARYPEKQQRHFEGEVKILRMIRGLEISAHDSKWSKVREDHIVNILASFTDPEAFGILMSPVALFDLKELLQKFSNPSTEDPFYMLPSDSRTETAFRRDQLLGCLGCIASSVSFLHKFHIRHRDLKPANVLICPRKNDSTDWQICLCDFATAQDYSENPRSLGQTSEAVQHGPRTYYYESPEARAGAPRDISEDMWHIGCIFLEILLVACKKTQSDLHDLALLEELEASDSPELLRLHERYFRKDKLRSWLDGLPAVSPNPLAVGSVVDWVKNLLFAEGPGYKRMTSEQLVESIATKVEIGQGYLARDCCREFFPGPPPVFQEPFEEARFEVTDAAGKVEYSRKFQDGAVSVFNPQTPNLERRLQISEEMESVAAADRTNSVETWLPILGMKITRDPSESHTGPSRIVVEWSDFNQTCKEPSEGVDYSFRYWLGFDIKSPNWKLEVHFRKKASTISFINILLAVHHNGLITQDFQQISTQQAFSIQEINSPDIQNNLSSILWPEHKLTSTTSNCNFQLSKIAVIRQEDLKDGPENTHLTRFYTAYLIRDKPPRFDLQLQDKSLKLRGLETVTYRLSEKREGTPRERKKYPLPNPQLDFKGSLPWDLEVWLPSDSFRPGGPGDGHLGIYNNSQAGAPATPHPTSSNAQIPNFLRFMGTILGHNLEWFCSVPHVNLFKGHLLQWAGARRTGPWVLMLWRVRGEEKPWLVLREVGKELGRGQWWYGQVEDIPKTERTKLTVHVRLRNYQHHSALDMTRLLASKPQSKEKPETHKLSVEFYTDEECCSFGSIKYQREPA